MNQGADNFAAKLQALKDTYVSETLPEYTESLSELSATLRSGTLTSEDLEQLIHVAHKLAGSGGTFGFPEISDKGRELEEACIDVKADSATSDPKSLKRLGRMLGELQSLTNSALGGDKEPVVTVYRDFGGGNFDKGEDDHSRNVVLALTDSSMAEAMSAELTSYGFNVSCADGPNGLGSVIDNAEPSVVVVDLDFGDEELHGGAATIDLLRDMSVLDCPVVFVSEAGDLDSRLAAADAGADAFFLFPVDTFRLAGTLDRLTRSVDMEPFRILIVDDDAASGRFMETVMHDAGMITRYLEDPSEIMEALEAFAPELILLDLYLPHYGGQQLANVIRQHEAFVGTPIIFVSAETDREVQLAAMSQGGDVFLTKPLNPSSLTETVRSRVQRFRILRSRMVRDSLTGLVNQSTTKQMLETEIERARRAKSALSFAMIDIDHFKRVNDTHGHSVGDRVIRALSRLLRQRLRSIDIIGRMGGEEFGVVLSDTTAETAHQIFDGIREDFSQQRHESRDGNFAVSFSCGIAEFPTCDGTQSIIDEADRALYAAKHAGRNKVLVASDVE